ncbi:shieldin complex subunit 3 isoform X2 [Acanthopagrus latus]|uniref:shieldin complex subunit 3 isoform X2 n=1 Tax=Acanthopagrus latus TaxID=8177 RepID=UPI00187BD557|nr:shieldin complex subunit 3 isoform X2 [Acanthopagrus latus]
MEDVVLYYQPGSAAGLSSLIERTEKLLESFPCRTPPVFSPWFPTDRHLPIRPARSAPIITCLGDVLVETTRTAHENPQEHKEDVSNRADRDISRLSPEKHKDKGVFSATHSPLKRSWSVFTQKQVPLQSCQSLSKHFHRMVSVHRLHLRQRVKWVISQHNCGAGRDIEQVWQAVSRSIRSSRLPTCNANIQRERVEIWVFCDVVHSEQVGRFLKDELQLLGRISLSVHKLGNIFSM